MNTTHTKPAANDNALPRLRNGLIDGDAVRRMQNYTGPTALQIKAGAKTHDFYAKTAR